MMSAYTIQNKHIFSLFKYLTGGLLLLILGMYLYTGVFTTHSQPLVSRSAPAVMQQVIAPSHKVVKLDSFLIRLMAGQSSRLSRVNISLKVSDFQVKNNIKNSLKKVRNHLVFILSTQDESVFADLNKKTILEQHIINQLNLFLPKGKIEQIQLTQTFLN